MHIHTNLQQLPAWNNAVITIGTFDGVHTGHRQIIQLMLEEAAKINGETVIITFHPHPRHVIASNQSPVFLLNTMDEKAAQLATLGIHHLVIIPFTEDFSLQSAEGYIEDFLVKHFHPHTIIIGHDHRFGNSRKGDLQLLESMAPQFGYTVKEIPGFMQQDILISSTRIREALQKGDIQSANHFLGYPYQFEGTVVEGNKLGRTIGYPTANLQLVQSNKLVPGNGVYAVNVSAYFKDGSHVQKSGMMNIGIRPTVEGTQRMIEVNIFDFDQEIYGENITVTIKTRLRNEQKFTGLDQLKEQLAKDKESALAALAS
ncbi:MAG: hypothetical protein RLY16_2707 [Bacteroidota bacterium]|jgi:riboflavin kinase/FMN adenylyltransferase